MNELIAALFIIALIFISTAGREFEAERDTTVRVECADWEKIAKSATEGMNFKEGMLVVDSLWSVIRAINQTEAGYKEIMLIIERQIPQPCPINENRKRDEPYYGCLVHHFKFVYDTIYNITNSCFCWCFNNYD